MANGPKTLLSEKLLSSKSLRDGSGQEKRKGTDGKERNNLVNTNGSVQKNGDGSTSPSNEAEGDQEKMCQRVGAQVRTEIKVW